VALNAISQALNTADPASQRPAQEAIQDAVIQAVAAVQELQRLKVNVLAGAGAATPIALAGIATTDTILAALLFKDPAASTTASVVALTASIPSAANVQFVEATNAAAGDRVVVLWYDKVA
jgi:hypothetical protein